MLRKELEDAKNALEKVGKYAGEKFRYAYAKNMDYIKAEFEKIKEMSAPTEEFKEYQQAQIKLVQAHADLDDEGKYKIEDNRIVMKDTAAFEEDAKKLDEEYTEVRTAAVERQNEIVAYLEKEFKGFFHKIKEADVPKDMAAEEYAAIRFMIESEEEGK